MVLSESAGIKEVPSVTQKPPLGGTWPPSVRTESLLWDIRAESELKGVKVTLNCKEALGKVWMPLLLHDTAPLDC